MRNVPTDLITLLERRGLGVDEDVRLLDGDETKVRHATARDRRHSHKIELRQWIWLRKERCVGIQKFRRGIERKLELIAVTCG